MSSTGEQRTELAPPDPERIRQAIEQDEAIGPTELKRWLAWQQGEIDRLTEENRQLTASNWQIGMKFALHLETCGGGGCR